MHKRSVESKEPEASLRPSRRRSFSSGDEGKRRLMCGCLWIWSNLRKCLFHAYGSHAKQKIGVAEIVVCSENVSVWRCVKLAPRQPNAVFTQHIGRKFALLSKVAHHFEGSRSCNACGFWKVRPFKAKSCWTTASHPVIKLVCNTYSRAVWAVILKLAGRGLRAHFPIPTIHQIVTSWEREHDAKAKLAVAKARARTAAQRMRLCRAVATAPPRAGDVGNMQCSPIS